MLKVEKRKRKKEIAILIFILHSNPTYVIATCYLPTANNDRGL